MKFIYVFDSSDKERLVNIGYKLLKEDNVNSIYIFKSDAKLSFDKQDMEKFVFSDVLSF
jgi:hypothetical protein